MTEHSDNSFDDQALQYAGRAGLSPTVGSLVARSIARHARAGPGDLVVELGAGTGEIGTHIASLPVRYVRIDSSPAMLDVFRARTVLESSSLVVADLNHPWPLPDGSAAAVVASRVIQMCSIPVDPLMRARILAALRLWSRGEFGDLDRPAEFRER
jgi:ubiquinone/menaquinone biosynthesis C-methylase UbiE